MNNSSDSSSESDNNEINKIKIDVPKKRGRPRKNLYLEKSNKQYERKEITNDEKDIILHLPVFLGKNKKIQEKELENKKDTSNEIENESDDESISSVSEDVSINSSDSDINDNNSSDEVNYKKLYKVQIDENKKKDLIIKKLKDELDKKTSSNIFDSDVQKDLKTHIINLNLIDNNTNKVIEAKKTDLNCWLDTCPINDYSYFLPEKYYMGKFYVFGCFCSKECAASYNLNMNDYKVMGRFALLQKLYGPIKKLAPPKEILTKFGGIVDIDKYRKNFETCDKEYRLNLPPMVLLNHIIDEVTIEKNEKDNFTKSNVGTFNKKKLPMVKNNLFNTMGIKNK